MPDRALSADELEIAWSLHGELFYLAIRPLGVWHEDAR
jgi:hypothetical protein